MSRQVRLSVLDNVRIASPCPMEWERMEGDDRRRYCPECRLHVHNLSALTRQEAEALILGAEGRLCGAYFQRSDGTILTRDCPVGIAAVRRRAARLAMRAAAAIGFVMAAGWTLATGREAPRLRDTEPFASLHRLLAPIIPAPTPSIRGTLLLGDVFVPLRADPVVPDAPFPVEGGEDTTITNQPDASPAARALPS